MKDPRAHESEYWINIFGKQSMHGHATKDEAIQEIEDYGPADYVTTIHIVDEEFSDAISLLPFVRERERTRREEAEHEIQERWAGGL